LLDLCSIFIFSGKPPISAGLGYAHEHETIAVKMLAKAMAYEHFSFSHTKLKYLPKPAPEKGLSPNRPTPGVLAYGRERQKKI